MTPGGRRTIHEHGRGETGLTFPADSKPKLSLEANRERRDRGQGIRALVCLMAEVIARGMNH